MFRYLRVEKQNFRSTFGIVAESDMVYSGRQKVPETRDGFVVVSIGAEPNQNRILTCHVDGRKPKDCYMRLNFQCRLENAAWKRNFCLTIA